MVSGVCFMAMPLNIIGANFNHHWSTRTLEFIVEGVQRSFLRADTVESLLAAFQHLDADSSGTIDSQEFERGLNDLSGMRLAPTFIRQVWAQLDVDRRNAIDARQWMGLFREWTVEWSGHQVDSVRQSSRESVGSNAEGEALVHGHEVNGTPSCRQIHDGRDTDARLVALERAVERLSRESEARHTALMEALALSR